MEDKKQSYLSLVQVAVTLFLPYLVLYVKEPGEYGKEISSIQKLIGNKIQTDGLR